MGFLVDAASDVYSLIEFNSFSLLVVISLDCVLNVRQKMNCFFTILKNIDRDNTHFFLVITQKKITVQ